MSPSPKEEAAWPPLICSDPAKAGKTNSIWGCLEKKLHRSPMGFLSHSTSPFTSRGAELQWSYASLLASFPFRQHSLRHSTPQRVEAVNVCTDQPARESITDNIAHCSSHPPAWRG